MLENALFYLWKTVVCFVSHKISDMIADLPSLHWHVLLSHCPLPQHSRCIVRLGKHNGQLMLFSSPIAGGRNRSTGVTSRVAVLVALASSSDLWFARRMALRQLARKRWAAPAVARDASSVSWTHDTQLGRSILTITRSSSSSSSSSHYTQFCEWSVCLDNNSGKLKRPHRNVVLTVTNTGANVLY